MINRRGGVVVFLVALFWIGLSIGSAWSHDSGQWEKSDPATVEWYRTLMMPDNPQLSCCGTADAYWADEVHVRNGKTYATITDDRDDAPLRRPHVERGTVIEIPDHKLKWDRGNPTGHTILFMSGTGIVFCFVQGSGI